MRTVALLIGLLATIGAIGVVDVVTGPAYGFSLFYLVPISIGAWSVGARVGLPVALAAAASWFVADLVDRTPDTVLASAWNGFTRLVIFGSVALLLSLLRARERQATDLDRFRGELFELIDRQLPQRLERVRRLARARSGGGATRELAVAVDDLVLLTNSVVALSLVASGASDATAELPPILEESVRAAADRDRIVMGARPPARVAIEPRVLRFVVSGVLVAALRATTGYVRVAASRQDRIALVTVEVDSARDRAGTRELADLVLALATARAALERHGGSVAVDDAEGVTVVRLSLPVAERPWQRASADPASA